MTRLSRLIVVLSLLPAWAAAAEPPPATAPAAPATKPAAATKPADLPFQNEIEAFEAADRKSLPAPGGVLFLGSSSIRLWKTLAEDFPGVPVLNRGFGGSTIPDSTRYLPRIVLPYKPRLIVFYAGDNDLAAGHTPARVLADFKELAAHIRRELPATRLLFIAIKPSIARIKLFDQIKEANGLVRDFTATDPRLGFIDTFTPMLGEDGKPRKELLGPDGLHMNRMGYELWTSIIAPLLKAPATAPSP